MYHKRCDHAAALVKGLVEHNNGRRYFPPKALGFESAFKLAQLRGWVHASGSLTIAGNDAYEAMRLYVFPTDGYAYTWDWNRVPSFEETDA